MRDIENIADPSENVLDVMVRKSDPKAIREEHRVKLKQDRRLAWARPVLPTLLQEARNLIFRKMGQEAKSLTFREIGCLTVYLMRRGYSRAEVGILLGYSVGAVGVAKWKALKACGAYESGEQIWNEIAPRLVARLKELRDDHDQSNAQSA